MIKPRVGFGAYFNMNTREDFGKKVAEQRTIKRMTQPELAEKSGVQQNTISRIENGRFNPGLDIINRIADALELEHGFENK